MTHARANAGMWNRGWARRMWSKLGAIAACFLSSFFFCCLFSVTASSVFFLDLARQVPLFPSVGNFALFVRTRSIKKKSGVASQVPKARETIARVSSSNAPPPPPRAREASLPFPISPRPRGRHRECEDKTQFYFYLAYELLFLVYRHVMNSNRLLSLFPLPD